MKATLVSICPTDAARVAGRHALTPELLAATGARYSRNNEGLEAIAAKIDPNRLDASVDSIFRMLDYGHQSIADMVPVAIFMDGISMWLAYHVWSLASVAGGQESSTRYIRMSPESLLPPETLGIPEAVRGEWRKSMEEAFARYAALEAAWTGFGKANPAAMRIPAGLMADDSDKAKKQVARMVRNFSFDRARYLLPSALSTNVMLVMSARAWAALCVNLSSQPLPEANALAEALRAELALAAPHLLRHANATEDAKAGVAREFEARRAIAASLAAAPVADAAPTAHLEAMAPAGADGAAMAAALDFHANRYAWQGPALTRTAVRFSWDAVAFAEMRDLNRHRTGSKYSTFVPRGFYVAGDQVPGQSLPSAAPVAAEAAAAAKFGCGLTGRARALLAAGDPSYIYWTLLGTEFDFEHVTTADKFIYEAELRTGTGAHYRYAQHLRDALGLWYARYPETKGKVLEGSAEPE